MNRSSKESGHSVVLQDVYKSLAYCLEYVYITHESIFGMDWEAPYTYDGFPSLPMMWDYEKYRLFILADLIKISYLSSMVS